MDYARDTGCIRIAKNAAIPYVPWSMISSIHCDGVIAYAESAEQLSLLMTLNVPVVNATMHTEPSHAIPTVHSHNQFMGKLAAEHMLSLGLKFLDRKFRQSLGHSVTVELRLERIRLARPLLVSTDMKVLDIGLRCGFDSSSGFVRAFRESTGCSPGKFRSGNAKPQWRSRF